MKTNKTFTIAALLLGSALIACSSGGGLGGGEDGEVDPAGTPGGIPDTSGTGSSGVTPPDENVSPSVGGGPGGPGMLCARSKPATRSSRPTANTGTPSPAACR